MNKKSILSCLVSLILTASATAWAQTPKDTISPSIAQAVSAENKSRLRIENGQLFYNGQGNILWVRAKGKSGAATTSTLTARNNGELPEVGAALKPAGRPPVHTIDIQELPKNMSGTRKDSYAWALGKDLGIDTFAALGDWNKYLEYAAAGTIAGTKPFVDPGTYVHQNAQGEEEKISGSLMGSFMLAFIDPLTIPDEYRTPSPYDLDKIKDGPTPETASIPDRDFFAYKVLLPGTNICWKNKLLGKDSKGPRALKCEGQVAYTGGMGTWLPKALAAAADRGNKEVVIVLGRSYIGDDPRPQPQIVAEWKIKIADLLTAKYLLLTSGENGAPAFIVGLIPTLPRR